MTKRSFAAAIALAIVVPAQALAWGATGHTMIGRLAVQNLPASVPSFLRAEGAIDEIAMLGPEEDRLRGSGESWDGDNDEGHFLDVADDGTIAGVVRLDAMPKDMAAYADALARVGTTPYRQGYVQYNILDGFEHVRKDLAYWRIDDYLSTHALTNAARARFSADRALRESVTLRDIGDWGHFVGDGSQPLHITVHYNGWGKYPNPNGFTTKHIHSFFESQFVDRYASLADVAKLVPAYAPSNPQTLLSQQQLSAMVDRYLATTASHVAPLYRLYGAGAFDTGSKDAVAFTDAQLARGVGTFRDLIALAWEDSINQSVGYPAVAVKDILTGKVVPARFSD